MNKPRLIARLKADALEKAYVLALAAVFVGVFLALDAAFHHSRQPIAFGAALIAGWAASSLVNTLLSDAYQARMKHLRNAIPAATATGTTKASPETETAR